MALASGYDPVFRPGRRAITTHKPRPVSAKAGRTETGRLWMYVRDEWPRAARRPLRSGSSTHWIARGQRPRLICRTLPTSCRPTACGALRRCKPPAGSTRQPAGRMRGASTSNCTPTLGRRSRCWHWNTSLACPPRSSGPSEASHPMNAGEYASSG